MKKFLPILLFLPIIGYSLGCKLGDRLSPIIVKNVTVNDAGDVTICWVPSTDSSIATYYIFRKEPPGANVKVDTLIANGSTCFTILNANNYSKDSSEFYSIGVIDSCGNEEVVTLDYHNTIFLDTVIDICQAKVTLNWNPYDDFASGLNVLYEVYVRINGGVPTLVDTTSNTTFDYKGINGGTRYDFHVVGIENYGAGPLNSRSGLLTLNSDFLVKPTFLYFSNATVANSSQNDLTFFVDTAADIVQYNVLRAVANETNFTSIGLVNDFRGMNPLVRYSDNGSNSDEFSYSYKVDAIDKCGKVVFTSNIGKTILLEEEANRVGPVNTFTWSNYEGWLGKVQEYEIYRHVNGNWTSSPIAQKPFTTGLNEHSDDVSSILIGNGEFCYRIKAIEKNALRPGNLPNEISWSNEICITHKPIMYIPNAFDPLSDFNPEFKPVLTYASPDEYLMVIHNRWGQKVFETRNSEEGWNGRIDNNGSILSVGTYLYYIHFVSADGFAFARQGKITLIQ